MRRMLAALVLVALAAACDPAAAPTTQPPARSTPPPAVVSSPTQTTKSQAPAVQASTTQVPRGVFQPGRTCDPTAARPDKPFNNRCADARCPDPNAHGYDEANAHGRR